MPAPSSLTRQPPSASRVDVDPGGPARHGLVDRVVDDLPDQVVQPGRAGGADVHAGPLAHRLEPFEDGDVVLGVRRTRPRQVSRPPLLPQARPFRTYGLRGAYRIPERCTSGLSMRTHHSTRRRLQFGTSERSAAAATRGVAQARSTTTSRRSIGGLAQLPQPGQDLARFHAGPGRPGRVVHRHHERRARRRAAAAGAPPSSGPTSSSQRVKTASMIAGVGAEPSRPEQPGHRVARPAAGPSSAPAPRHPVLQVSARGAAGPPRSPRAAAPPWSGSTGPPAARPPGPGCGPGRARRRRRRGAASGPGSSGRGPARARPGAGPGPGSAARPGTRGSGPRGPRSARSRSSRWGPTVLTPRRRSSRRGWPRARRAGRPSQLRT